MKDWKEKMTCDCKNMRPKIKQLRKWLYIYVDEEYGCRKGAP
jgi:hypothetical protein